jgi:RNA polymerase sigma factor (sigma-70 family)
MDELYQVLSRRTRGYLYKRRVLADVEDRVNNVYLAVASAIRSGSLRQPEALAGFATTIVKRQAIAGIADAIRTRSHLVQLTGSERVIDNRPDPEMQAIQNQKKALMMKLLQEIAPRDREMLTRFYLHGQTPSEICREMGLTETQYRLCKSRAKVRFRKLVEEQLHVNEVVPCPEESADV